MLTMASGDLRVFLFMTGARLRPRRAGRKEDLRREGRGRLAAHWRQKWITAAKVADRLLHTIKHSAQCVHRFSHDPRTFATKFLRD